MKKVVIIVGVAVVLLVALFSFFRYKTKSLSPEANVEFKDGNLAIHIFYNRPYKKGREIFGKLVPFGKTWRTGANETTVFETSSDLKFGDKELKAGKYSLWTVPGERAWEVIFNSKIPFWGVSFNQEASRDSVNDVLKVESPVAIKDKEFEQFTISVEKVSEGEELILMWDKTLVAVPFSPKP